MGAYLHIGLRARLSALKGDTSAKTNELKKLLGSQVDLSIYDEQETSDNLLWTLKPSLLEQELVPFLQKQFDLIPSSSEAADRKEMLTELLDLLHLTGDFFWADLGYKLQFDHD